MKKLISILTASILLGLTSCASTYMPEARKLREIENITYEEGTMDCVDKSVMYSDYLLSQGEKARVVDGKVKGCKNLHVWVEAYRNGKWFMIDPTFKKNKDGFEVDKYYEWNLSWFIMNPNSQRKPQVIYQKDATAKDIRSHDKIEKIIWENIP